MLTVFVLPNIDCPERVKYVLPVEHPPDTPPVSVLDPVKPIFEPLEGSM
jgi:hypothetical protein